VTNDILPLLIAERDRLNRALEALQGAVKRRGRPPKNPLSASPATDIPKLRRGRPPKNPLAALAPTAPAPPRKGMSTAARKALSERMKKYWAKRRKAA
jgi:hypothetical protein